MVHVHTKPVLVGIGSLSTKEYGTLIAVLEKCVLDIVVQGVEPSDKIKVDLELARILREESVNSVLSTVARGWFEHCSRGDLGRLVQCRLDYVPAFLKCAPHVQINMEIHSQLCAMLHRVNIRKLVDEAQKKGKAVTESYVRCVVNAFNWGAYPALHEFYDDVLNEYYTECIQKEAVST